MNIHTKRYYQTPRITEFRLKTQNFLNGSTDELPDMPGEDY